MADLVRFNMRFPDGVRDELSRLADERGISRNREIVRRLGLPVPANVAPVGFQPVVCRGSDQTIVFMPRDLHEHLVGSAKANGRSLQAECLYRLMAGLEGAAVDAPAIYVPPGPVGVPVSELQRVRRKVEALLSEIDLMIERAS